MTEPPGDPEESPVNLLDDYLVRAHQQDLLRAACARRPERCASRWAGRLRRRGA